MSWALGCSGGGHGRQERAQSLQDRPAGRELESEETQTPREGQRRRRKEVGCALASWHPMSLTREHPGGNDRRVFQRGRHCTWFCKCADEPTCVLPAAGLSVWRWATQHGPATDQQNGFEAHGAAGQFRAEEMGGCQQGRKWQETRQTPAKERGGGERLSRMGRDFFSRLQQRNSWRGKDKP